MARSMQPGQVTPADELRELLSANERLLPNLRGRGAGAVSLLENLDRIAELWPELEAAGADLRPEQGRWDTIRAQVRRQAGLLVRELRAAGGLPALRGRLDHEPSNWWWFLDQEVSARRRRSALRMGVTALIVVIALGGAFLLFQKLFPVDPRVSAATARISAGQQKIDANQDYAGALADFRAAATALPDDPEGLLWVAAAEEKLGRVADAQQDFARAQALYSSELDFHLGRASVYLQMGLDEPARAQIIAALGTDPQNPQAYYFLASVEENEGRLQQAVDALAQSGQYADARQQNQLSAMARVRQGLLMQRMLAQAGPTDATP